MRVEGGTTMRQLVIAMIITLCVFSFPTVSQADDDSSLHTWKTLNQTSDRILQLVKVEQYEEAKQLLDYFSTVFLDIDFQAEGVTMNALRMVTITYEKAEEAVTSVSLPLSERISLVTSFRLAVDALSSDYHPLWLNSEAAVMHAIQSIEEALKQKDAQAYQHRLNEFLRHYQTIHPALFIDLEVAQLQQIQSQITFLEKRRNQFDPDVLIPHLSVMKEEWTNLYKREKEDSADPSLWWVMMTIGGMITLSLTYVGWRKYRAEKQKVRVKE